MDAVTEFFAMGGYALYVWGAYGMTFGLIGAEIALLALRSRRRRVTADEPEPAAPKWESAP